MRAKFINENIFVQKAKSEIQGNLFLVYNPDDLEIGDDYYIFDSGTDNWFEQMVYKGSYNGLYRFESGLQFDNFSMNFTEDELWELIHDKEIAFNL